MAAPGDPAVVLFGSAREGEVRERALVLTALGIPHEVVRSPGWSALVVPAALAPRAAEELARWRNENRERVPLPEPPDRPGALDAALGLALALVVVFLAERAGAWGRDWDAAGEAVAGRIVVDQPWRALTALTLHVDPAHLAGNIVFGAAFVGGVARRWGAGLALLATLVAGTLGNLVNAAVQDSSHVSVGASTAVFAALGLLGAALLRHRRRAGEGRLRRWSPAVAALLLLAYLGTEGARTDVGAHVFGFASGALVGGLCDGWLDRLATRPAARRAAAALAVGLLVGAWAVALA